MSGLVILLLSDNQLTGEIPEELAWLDNLETLWLSDNRLTGEIPSGLGGLNSLTYVLLTGNWLTGCAPAKWRDIENEFVGLPFCPPE